MFNCFVIQVLQLEASVYIYPHTHTRVFEFEKKRRRLTARRREEEYNYIDVSYTSKLIQSHVKCVRVREKRGRERVSALKMIFLC